MEVGVLRQAEEEDLVEDFSTVSPWERFTCGLEEAIRSWGIADSRECAEGVELPTGGEQNYVSVDIDLEWSLGCVEAFRLVLDLGTPEVDVRRFWNRHARSVGDHTSPMVETDPPTESLRSDAVSWRLSSHIYRWFGEEIFLLLFPVRDDVIVDDPTLLSSALATAISSTNCALPAFADLGGGSLVGYKAGAHNVFHYESSASRGSDVIPPAWSSLSTAVSSFDQYLSDCHPTAELCEAAASLRYSYLKDFTLPSASAFRNAKAFLSKTGDQLKWGCSESLLKAVKLDICWNDRAVSELRTEALRSCNADVILMSASLRDGLSGHKTLPFVCADLLHALSEVWSMSLRCTSMSSCFSDEECLALLHPRSYASALLPLRESIRCVLDDALAAALAPDLTPPTAEEGAENSSHSVTWSLLKACVAGSPLCVLAVFAAQMCQSASTPETALRCVLLLWAEYLADVRSCWEERVAVPGVPEGDPDLRSCIAMQKLQMLNVCIGRAVAEAAAPSPHDLAVDNWGSESLEEAFSSAGLGGSERLGVAKVVSDRVLLLSGDPVCEPITQLHSVYTEDVVLAREAALAAVGTGEEATRVRMQMQCGSLISDMSAFKAANPNACLPDFIRWYSPRDWIPEGPGCYVDEAWNGRGEGFGLSTRMSTAGNLWQTAWDGCEAIPVSQQQRVFDCEKEAECALHDLAHMPPAVVLETLLRALIVEVDSTLAVPLRRLAEETGPEMKAVSDCFRSLGTDLTVEEMEAVCGVVAHVELFLSKVVSLREVFAESLEASVLLARSGRCVLKDSYGDINVDSLGVLKDLGLAGGGDKDAPRPNVWELTVDAAACGMRVFVRNGSDEFRLATSSSSLVPKVD